jgi:hypothetical protein
MIPPTVESEVYGRKKSAQIFQVLPFESSPGRSKQRVQQGGLYVEAGQVSSCKERLTSVVNR